MNLGERMKKFNKRWSMASTDSYEESFRKFKTRILNSFKGIDNYVTKNSITQFCQYYAIPEQWQSSLHRDGLWSTNIQDRLEQEGDEKEFYRLIELVLSLEVTTSGEYIWHGAYNKTNLFNRISEDIELSEVNVSITNSDEGVILYPRGEQMLDEDLVEFPLSFLDQKSGEHFFQALQFYQSKQHVKSAESLRRSLEEFLKAKLGNGGGLKANILALQTRLKSDRCDAQVRNVIGATFNHLDQYFNDNSKHNDGDIDDSENEFLIYQSGLLMRYINKNLIP